MQVEFTKNRLDPPYSYQECLKRGEMGQSVRLMVGFNDLQGVFIQPK